MPRPIGLYKYKVRLGQVRVTEVNEPKETLMQIADVIEEWRYDVLLVGWTQKVVRESPSGETCGNLGVSTRRSADGSDPRTYQRVVVC